MKSILNFFCFSILAAVTALGAFAAPPKMKSIITPAAGKLLRSYPAPKKKGGTLTVRSTSNPSKLNPLINTEADTRNVLSYLFSPLLDQDLDTGDYYPGLAEAASASPDYKTLEFTLRKNATWQDGTPITTDDAEFTFQTIMNPKVDAAILRNLFGPMEFEKIDQQRFRLKISNPTINTVPLVVGTFELIQKAQFKDEKDFNTARGIMNPVGSGPYRLKSLQRDQKIELERVQNWWGDALPENKAAYNYDKILFRIIPDHALSYEKFMKGEIDAINFFSEIYGNQVKGVDRDRIGKGPDSDKPVWATHHVTSAPPQRSFIGWNLNRPIFQSKKTRQALAMLVDYPQVIEKIYQGESIQSFSAFGTLTPNFDPEVKKRAFHFDVPKAIRYLKEDGWSDPDGQGVLSKVIDGKRVPFRFNLGFNSNNPMRGKVAQMVRENFKKAGIDVTIQAVEWLAYLDQMDQRNYDAVVMGWANGFLHPDARQIWHSSSIADKGSNFVSYRNPVIDTLIEESNREFNPAKRQKMMQKIGSILYDEQPYLFLVELPGFLAGYQSKIRSPNFAFRFQGALGLSLFYSE